MIVFLTHGYNQIYRQSSGNIIVESAYAINRGEMPNLDSVSEEFSFIPVKSYDMMMKAIIDVYKRETRACRR